MAIGDTFGGLAEDAKKIPWWGWVAGAGAGFLLWQHFQSGATTASTPPSSTPDSSAATLDTSGGMSADGIVAPGPSGGVNVNNSGGIGPSENPGGGPGQVRQPILVTGQVNPPPPPPPPPPPAPKPTQQSYTVQSGDTLSAIASHHGIDEQALYSANQNIIESTARAHGFANSDNGHWIFPGERLVIP